MFFLLSYSDSQSVNYKILQLLQSGRRGEHADTDFVPTEIWPDWISLDAHRLSKIYNSFNPVTEKEALAPGCHIYIFFCGGRGVRQVHGGGGVLSALAIQVHKICLCVCVWGGGGDGDGGACVGVCVGDSVSARVLVFHFQCMSVSLCFVWLSMSSNVLLCWWFLCEYLCIPYFCLIKQESTLSIYAFHVLV